MNYNIRMKMKFFCKVRVVFGNVDFVMLLMF